MNHPAWLKLRFLSDHARVASLLVTVLGISAALCEIQADSARDPAAHPRQIELTGRLSVIYEDPPRDSGQPWELHVFLTADDGLTAELLIDHALLLQQGHFMNWAGKRVRIRADERSDGLQAVGRRGGRLKVNDLTLLPELEETYRLEREGQKSPKSTPAAQPAVLGNQPWATILCKYPDRPGEPDDLAYFQEMYANSPGRLDHYWRESSYNAINLTGSTAIDWVQLPDPYASYVAENNQPDLQKLSADCLAAAEPQLDFSNGGSGFYGINMGFNDSIGNSAWGGRQYRSLGGISKVWGITWLQNPMHSHLAVVAHEMGHGLGLPHSNNWDQDDSPYDNPWDVMSGIDSNAAVDPDYGLIGKHTNAYHKYLLSWIGGSRLLEVPAGAKATATIDAMADLSTANYRMARIPRAGGGHYTVEARKPMGAYDGVLPGNAVLIYEVDPNRGEPSWAVDTDLPPADYGNNEGTMFRAGETFVDPSGTISVSIDSETADGFVVTIENAVANTDNELINLSTRAEVRTGDDIAIGGFVIHGNTDKCVVVQALGPSVGVPAGIERLPDPVLTLKSGQTTIAQNDNWQVQDNPADAITIANLGASYVPNDVLEAAIYKCLPPGAYTALVTGYLDTTGVGQVAVYDADNGLAYLENISTRSWVGTGDRISIGGFVIWGDQPKQILVRGIGPSMQAVFPPGAVLNNPELRLYRGNTLIATNDNWGDAANVAEISALPAHLRPSDPRESAILMVLEPGLYTAHLLGVGGETGNGLVGVDDLTGR